LRTSAVAPRLALLVVLVGCGGASGGERGDASRTEAVTEGGAVEGGAVEGGAVEGGAAAGRTGTASGGIEGEPTARPDAATGPSGDDAALTQVRALFAEGVAAYEAGRLDEALAKLGEAYRLHPSPDLAFNVARVCERMGEAAQGILYFGHYLRDGAPTEAERADVARRIAGLEALAARQRDQIFAAPASTDALTAEARTFFQRGVAMFQRRAFGAAMQAFTAAYGFARLPEVVYNLAITAEKLGRAQEAIDYYREFLRARPEDPSRAQIEARLRTLRAGR
jgi:tetratricopeptide (TPR) repeat protein